MSAVCSLLGAIAPGPCDRIEDSASQPGRHASRSGQVQHRTSIGTATPQSVSVPANPDPQPFSLVRGDPPTPLVIVTHSRSGVNYAGFPQAHRFTQIAGSGWSR